ncbi:UNVERIFIED_CONTAM: hypothetical protein HDU68_010406 [Siphonaria sp. JEL0065]|nr:hypothetical protein HDU68_010406 [Siphonaria sp. JEL0065]
MYPDVSSNSHFGDVYFNSVHIADHDPNTTSFDNTSRLLQEYQVKKGKECVDKDEPLFRVTAVTAGNNQTPSLFVMSLSHTLGDGFTFYSIYSMFEKSPYAMIVEREKDFAEQSKAVLGNEQFQFLSSPGFIIGAVANLASSAPPIVIEEIDLEIVKKVKEEAAKEGGVDFVSTNDVVTSEYLANCGLSYGMMAINMRGKVACVGEKHAGNYMGSLVLTDDQFRTPASLRTALKTLHQTAVPTFWQACLGRNAVASNWASFHHELVLPGNLSPLDHHPLQRDIVHMVWTTGIIYKPTADKLALLYGKVQPQIKLGISKGSN